MLQISTIPSFYRLWKYLKQLEQYNYQKTYQKLNIGTNSEYLVQYQYFSRGRQYVKSFGLLGLCFQELVSRTLTDAELQRIILLSHFAPVYDDLFDQLNTSKEHIINLINNPEQTSPQTPEEHLFLSFYMPVFQEMKNKNDFFQFFLLLTDSQEHSKQQMNTNVSFDELNTITRNKGGYSCLLLRSLIDEPMPEQERQGLFQLGALSQYMDDIFDWHDDLKENINTIANKLSLEELYQFYTNQLNSFKQADLSTAFISQVVVLLKPVFVCLDHYKKHVVTTSQITPERIVCDMEKPANMMRLVLKSMV